MRGGRAPAGDDNRSRGTPSRRAPGRRLRQPVADLDGARHLRRDRAVSAVHHRSHAGRRRGSVGNMDRERVDRPTIVRRAPHPRFSAVEPAEQHVLAGRTRCRRRPESDGLLCRRRHGGNVCAPRHERVHRSRDDHTRQRAENRAQHAPAYQPTPTSRGHALSVSATDGLVNGAPASLLAPSRERVWRTVRSWLGSGPKRSSR